MKIKQEQLFDFLKEEIIKSCGKSNSDVELFFEALANAKTVGDLRKIVNDFPLETALKACDVMTIYKQWVKLMEKNSEKYADMVFHKLLRMTSVRSQKRRCLI